MSQNIFDATLDPNNDVKVNNFDWSHANNLTTQIGRVTPIFCDLVPAKTSFRVNPRFGLQFMPMVFPIQTRSKARISWYRYPVRALWKDYKDFVGNFREGLEEPYINFNTAEKLKKMASTGSLGDYLGLPTTLVGDFGNSVVSSWDWRDGTLTNQCSTTLMPAGLTLSSYEELLSSKTSSELAGSDPAPSVSSFRYVDTKKPSLSEDTDKVSFSITFDSEDIKKAFYAGCRFVAYDSTGEPLAVISPASSDFQLSGSLATIRLSSDIVNRMAVLRTYFPSKQSTVFASPLGSNTMFMGEFGSVSYMVVNPNVVDIDLSTSPWYNSNSKNKDKQQKILAYGFRAYEGIYNAYIRDNRNNPYYLNGEVQYNKWIPSDEGGEDNNLYELRYANWEKDFLTTAVQSPQQGNAPLVGITTYAQTVANEDGTTTELVKTALVDEDGKKYGLSFKTSEEGLEGVEYIELDNGTQVRQARSLYDLATSGISIPDLRMVNCYQKFLELNMRKGYSYKDIVEGRFDVKVRYADLLMPEFFGGVSRDVDVNSVTQTVDQNASTGSGDYATALGSQSGIAGVRGEANANIECFCDEESIIMGILIVTPLPVYTQLLPKHFTYRGLMEHYQPEFNLIGFQPIKYNEVCPIQAYNDNPDSLTETFGYNRPWYEYAQKYDVAHGLFRTDLSNFLMHRVFDKKPELAQSFLLVDPEQVTDVFSVTETTDKIYGQIWLDITCKLPIARVAIPRLD